MIASFAASRQRPVVVAGLALVLALAAFAPHALEAWQHDVSDWDKRVSVAIHDAENRETLLNRYVDPFDVVLHPLVTGLGVAAVLVAAVMSARRGQRRLAAAILVGFVGAVVLVPLLKGVFARPPVDPGGNDGYAFPSGHAVRSAVEALTVTAAAWSTPWRTTVAVVGAVAVVLIGVGAVYHEWHWMSDVVGGWCLAVAWLACVWLVLRPSLVTRDIR